VGDAEISPRDAAELEACFAAHARDLFGFACALVRGDRALADDLVQSAFEAAARAWPTLRGLAEQQRQSWLRSTLANIAVSGFRRDAAFSDRLPSIEVRYGKTSDHAFSSSALERCWRIIKEMPKRQYTAALLRWRLGMKEAEIAAVLGIAENTVSAMLYRVRHTLTAQLGPDQLGPDHPFIRDDAEGAAS
jgi:RNA polymerase sigma-70 factor, ECF subfamily